MTAKRERNLMYAGLALLALSVATVWVRRAAGGSPPVRQQGATAGNGRARPPRPVARPSPVARVTPPVLGNDLIVRRNLFRPLGAGREGSGDRGQGKRDNFAPPPLRLHHMLPLPPPSPSPPSADLPPLPFRMAGMVDNGRSSAALLEEVDSGRYHLVTAGDKVADMEVVRVEAGRVVVKQGGVVRALPLAQGGKQETTGRGQEKKEAPDMELERRVMPKG